MAKTPSEAREHQVDLEEAIAATVPPELDNATSIANFAAALLTSGAPEYSRWLTGADLADPTDDPSFEAALRHELVAHAALAAYARRYAGSPPEALHIWARAEGHADGPAWAELPEERRRAFTIFARVLACLDGLAAEFAAADKQAPAATPKAKPAPVEETIFERAAGPIDERDPDLVAPKTARRSRKKKAAAEPVSAESNNG